MPEVDRRLAEAGGEHRIEWTEGFSGTVVKPRGELEAIETGIGDIGIVVTAFHVDKVPLYNIAFVTPFVTGDLPLVVRTIDELTERFPAMRESWERYNQVYLAATGTVDSYQVVTRRPVRVLDDFRGMKIGGAGPNLLWLEGIGEKDLHRKCSRMVARRRRKSSGIFQALSTRPIMASARALPISQRSRSKGSQNGSGAVLRSTSTDLGRVKVARASSLLATEKPVARVPLQGSPAMAPVIEWLLMVTVP